eukprot:352428-Chlamydomonas_euryale.AAC.1
MQVLSDADLAAGRLPEPNITWIADRNLLSPHLPHLPLDCLEDVSVVMKVRAAPCHGMHAVLSYGMHAVPCHGIHAVPCHRMHAVSCHGMH